MRALQELLVRLAERQAALSEAQRALHRLVELGLAEDAVGSATAGASERDVTVTGIVTPARPASPAGAAPGDAVGVKRCKYSPCGKSFQPKPGGKKRDYCSPRCRSRAAVARQRERRAAEDRAAAAAVMAQAERDGYPTTLKWRNGDGQTET